MTIPDASALATTCDGGSGAVGFRLGPGAVLEHYELIRQLGAGGMGMVFLARDTRLGRLVAIKFLLDHTGMAAERFLGEARATAQCRHENIVIIHAADEVDGAPYMVLEYIQGRTLRAAMAERAHDTAAVAIELMLPVARALACAHEMGLIHRDLKPENILLGDDGAVKVVDFGIAKQVSLDLAATLPARAMGATAARWAQRYLGGGDHPLRARDRRASARAAHAREARAGRGSGDPHAERARAAP
jgi:serine/threonine protein kinase